MLLCAPALGSSLQVYPSADARQAATIGADGLVRLSLVIPPGQGAVELALQPFLDDQGHAVDVGFGVPDGTAPSMSLPESGRHLLDLRVRGAEHGRTYRGELWMRGVAGTWEATSLELALPPARGITAPSGGTVTVMMDVRPLVGQTGTVSISTGRTAGGRIANLHLVAGASRERTLLDVPFPAATLPVTVDAHELPPDEAYVATLIAEAGGRTAVAYVEITRQAPLRAAVPHLEFSAVDARTSCGFFDGFRCTPDPIRVLLGEEHGRGLSGVYALGLAAADGTAAHTLLPGRLDVRFAGEAVLLNAALDAASVPVDPARSVAMESQREVNVAFADELGAGRYHARLQFGALDADPAQFPELVINLSVRTHWLWAAIALTAGVLGSFLVTKGLATFNRRAQILRQLSGLRQNYWLRLDRSGTPPIVGMRAELAKMQEALERETRLRAFTAQPAVGGELAQVLVHLPYVERLSACIAYWQGQQGYVARRARKALRTLTTRLEAVPWDVDPAARIGPALAEMEEWQNSALISQHYRIHLLGDIELLLRDVDERAISTTGTDSLEQAFDELEACIPDARRLAELQAAVEALDPQAPGAGQIARVQAGLQALSSTYGILRAELAEVRNSAMESAGASTLPALEQRIRSAFTAAGDAEAGPLRAIEEHLRVAATYNWPPPNRFDRVQTEVAAVKAIDPVELNSAISTLKATAERLSTDPAQVVRHLKHAIAAGKDQLTGLDDAVTLEKLYAALKIFWESRDDQALTRELLESYRRTPDPDKLFPIVDDKRWEALKDHLQIVRPASLREQAEADGDAAKRQEEAYRPITFEVAPDTYRLGNNYLFKHGLRYHWKIDFGDRVLDPVTSEPRVCQFIPREHPSVRVDVDVRYYRDDGAETLAPRWLKVTASRSFGLWNAFTQAELVGVAVALALAVGTGLSSQYVEAELLGTLGDYLTLFTWGFVADQARNILQNTGIPGNGQPAPS